MSDVVMEVGTPGPQGRGFIPSDTPYDGTKAYLRDSIVRVGNTQWRAKQDVPVGHAPAEDAYWTVFFDGDTATAESIAAANLAKAWASQPVGEDVEGASAGSRSALDRAAASLASASLSQAWASQPVGEDVAGAAPGSRSSFHWATTAANAVTAGLSSISDAVTAGLQSISNAVSGGLSAISGAIGDGLTAIGLARSNALTDVSQAGSGALDGIATARSNAEGAVNTAGTNQLTILAAAQTPAFNFSTTTTDADPGNGNVRFNNATLASVSFIYFDNLDSAGNNVSAWLNTMASNGIIIVTPVANNAQRLMFKVTGGVFEGGGYKKVSVAYLSGSILPSNAAVLAFTFSAAGLNGDASGVFKSYDNKSLATADIANIPDGSVIRVWLDESLSSLTSLYQKTGGSLVFKQFVDAPGVDFMGRPARVLPYAYDRIKQLHGRKALDDIVAGLRQSVRILGIGDSLATVNWNAVHTQMAEVIIPPYLGSDTFYRYANGGAATGEFNGTATRTEKVLPYTYNPIGTTTVHTSGQLSTWAIGNVGVFCDRALIPCVTESGAGIAKIEISESATRSGAVFRSPISGEIVSGPALTGLDLVVDCNAAAGNNVIQLEFATMERRVIRVTCQSGTVRIFDPFFEVKNAPAVNGYRMAVGSNGFGNAQAGSVTYMAPFIAAYKPDFIIVECDDDLAAFQNFLPILLNYIASAGLGYSPYVLLVGNPGIGTGYGVTEAGLKDRIRYMGQFALPLGWDVLDGLAYGGGIATLIEEGLQADQVHLTATMWRLLTVWWATQRGFIRARTPAAGGDRASIPDILAAATAPRELRVTEAMALLAMPNVADTGWMGWAAAVSGTGVGAKGNAKLTMNTGFTTTSKVRLYVNDAKPLFGVLGSGVQGVGSRGAIGFMLNVESTGTNCEAYFLGAARTWNSAYAGPLTGEGFGFRLRNNVLDGISWTGGAQVATASSKTLVTGTNARVYSCLMVWERLSGNSVSVTFYVMDNGVATFLGTLTATNTLGHYSAINGELTNGADAADYKVHFSPPRIAAIGA